MQNDDLIVSKRSAECPEDDEDDCIYDVEANKKDNLIYPMTVVTTRKPRQYAPVFLHVIWATLFHHQVIEKEETRMWANAFKRQLKSHLFQSAFAA